MHCLAVFCSLAIGFEVENLRQAEFVPKEESEKVIVEARAMLAKGTPLEEVKSMAVPCGLMMFSRMQACAITVSLCCVACNDWNHQPTVGFVSCDFRLK